MQVRRVWTATLVLAMSVALVASPASAAKGGKPGGGGGGGGDTTTVPVPTSMAALGDSITRAFDSCGWFVDCPGHSWSTGGDNDDVTSHFERLRALDSTMQTAYNVARTGAKVDELPGQAQAAVDRGAGYATILMGANDACTDSVDTMTDPAVFAADVEAALDTLEAAGVEVFVSSIPDVYRLWEVAHTSWSAVFTWNTADICQSLLASPTSTTRADQDRRLTVRDQVIAFNGALKTACAAHEGCHYDGDAVFNYDFTFDQLSGWDYFHPNEAGQAVLAQETWSASDIQWATSGGGKGGGKGGPKKK